MDLLREIRENLAAGVRGARKLQSLPAEYPAWTICTPEEYGVAVPYRNDAPFTEAFASCEIRAADLLMDDSAPGRYLFLASSDRSLRYEFSSVCAEFADPGEDGSKRRILSEEPLRWWEGWRELLGNAISDKEPYSVIAEMMVLDTLLRSHADVTWTAAYGGSHDIESLDESYEVKSTLRKYGSDVTISSHHQLRNDRKKSLSLYFCRMEKSVHGVSIDDMAARLVSDGYQSDLLERQLGNLGYKPGTSGRTRKYKCLEKRKYAVDDSFPRITAESFLNGRMPAGITKIEYTVDLDGLDYSAW
jgi:hypothetical protein